MPNPAPAPVPPPSPPRPKPAPEPEPAPAPQPDDGPEQEDPEETKRKKCNLLKAKAGNAELQIQTNNRVIAEHKAALERVRGISSEIVEKLTAAGVNAALDCVKGGSKGGIWGCLRSVLQGAASQIPDYLSLKGRLESAEHEEKILMNLIQEVLDGNLEEQRKIDESQSEMAQVGCL